MSSEVILKKNSNYVFTFGNVAVGKSTILAALASEIANNTDHFINTNNPDGNRQLMKWIDSISNSRFPNITMGSRILEVDFAIQTKEYLLPITLLETSGEQLNKVDVRNSNYSGLEQISDYIKISKLIILVASVDDAKQDDILLYQFLNYLATLGAIAPIALVLSKWDLIMDEQSLEIFVKENLPLVYNLISKSTYFSDITVIKHSVGSYLKDENEFLKSEINYTKDVFDWMLMKLNTTTNNR